MSIQAENVTKRAAPARALYSVIRYVPSLLREEFVNIGVVVIAPGEKWHGFKAVSSFGEGSRVKLLAGSDGMFVRHAVKTLAAALESQGADAWSEASFREFTISYAANNLQLTPPRPASADPAFLLDWLFKQLVEEIQPERRVAQKGRGVIREQVKAVFTQRGLFKLGLQEDYTLPVRSEPVVDLAYKNGVWHCYQAVAFDVEKRQASQQVNAFRQTVTDARNSDTPELAQGRFAVFTNEKGDMSLRADLLDLLKDQRIDVLGVDDAPMVAMQIQTDLRAHDLVTHPYPQA